MTKVVLSDADVEEDSKPPLLLSEEASVEESCDRNDCNDEVETSSLPSQSGKTIMVTPEDIEAAGLSMQNLSELTEEQFNSLVLIAERRQMRTEAADSSTLQNQKQFDDNNVDSSLASDSITMVITADGSLRLTDATGETFSFDSAQLIALRIDVNNLTDENIQQIVQMAMPAINIGSKDASDVKSKMDQRRRTTIFDRDLQSGVFKIPSYKSVLEDTPHCAQPPGEIRLRSDPQRLGSIPFVRYVKNGKCKASEEDELIETIVPSPIVPTTTAALRKQISSSSRAKVQYEDGRFEWVGEEVCNIKTEPHSDHSGYSAGRLSHEYIGPGVSVDSPELKRSRYVNAALGDGATPVKRRAPAQQPNFCCPVCAKKVYQKEPSYIVIRLPACDECTKERMIVLDERSRRPSLLCRQK